MANKTKKMIIILSGLIIIILVFLLLFPPIFPCSIVITNNKAPIEKNSYQIVISFWGRMNATELNNSSDDSVIQTNNKILSCRQRWEFIKLLQNVLSSEPRKPLVFGDTIQEVYLHIYEYGYQKKDYWSIYQSELEVPMTGGESTRSQEVLDLTYWIMENSPIKVDME